MRNDLTGQKRHMLTAIEPVKERYSSGHRQWRCSCDCGGETVIPSHLFGVTRSCGCLSTHNRLPKGEASRRALMRVYIKGAESRGLLFELTSDQFTKLTKGECHYCGDKPSKKYAHPISNGSYKYNGIDRMNNDIGYTLNNCVSCCWVCNDMKKAQGYGEFLSKVKQIHINNESKNSSQTA